MLETSTAPFKVEEATIQDLARAMAAGVITSEALVEIYLERIATYDKQGPKLNAILEVNPDALFIARALDRERQTAGPRGPLHGIPVLIKDNIDTHDKLHTSAGSLALATSVAPRDAFIVSQLRAAGAVILGKANMTEFANFMTKEMPSGYSSRGGQVINPYLHTLTPSGSSAGSGVAPAANLTAVAVGTETSGSILSPANNNSIVGIKPTVGLVSRTGIIPIAFSQDTAGPMTRTVADAATLLGALVGVDQDDPATAASVGRAYKDYTQFLDRDGLRGARIGVPAGEFWDKVSEDEKQLFAAAVAAMQESGAEIIDQVAIPGWADGYWQSNVLVYEFKTALNAYLATLGPGAPVRSISEIIAFNNRNPETCLRHGQTLLAEADSTSGTLTEPAYLLDRLKDIRLSRQEGIDSVVAAHKLDALLFPGSSGCWLPARAGYPSINVPAGYTTDGKPMGVTFTGLAWSEPVLIRLAYAFEQATKHRVPPAL
ncbi:MAG: amidase [Firmicutes bacterium]|nr:amidase [Bacillota bacterium]